MFDDARHEFINEAATRADSSAIRLFAAAIRAKHTGTWTGGKGILIDRQPYGDRTEFKHRLPQHTIALHLEGANTRMVLRHEGGRQHVTGSTVGHVMLIPAGHQLEGWSDYPRQIRHVLLLLDPVTLDARVCDYAMLERLELPFRLDLADGVIASRMRALQLELERPGLMGRLYAESLSNEIIVQIVRAHAASASAVPPARGGLAPRRLRMVQDYIEANLANDITLSDLASIAGISNTHFCRAFRKSVGLASHQYLIYRRVEQAKALLLQGELPIAAIARAVGFGNQSHMTTHFRRLVGTTPRRFRDAA